MIQGYLDGCKVEQGNQVLVFRVGVGLNNKKSR
jgi:hypothetical protein